MGLLRRFDAWLAKQNTRAAPQSQSSMRYAFNPGSGGFVYVGVTQAQSTPPVVRDMEIGDLVFGGGATRAHALLCDGSAVSRSTYSALYAVIGTAFGSGNGSTTFNLPDARGRPPVAIGTHADVSTQGNSDGVAVASRTPKHIHSSPQHQHELPLDGTNKIGSLFGGGSTGTLGFTITGSSLSDTRTLALSNTNAVANTGSANSGYLVVGNLFIVYE